MAELRISVAENFRIYIAKNGFGMCNIAKNYYLYDILDNCGYEKMGLYIGGTRDIYN